MTVQDTSNKIEYTGDGVFTGPYPFTFQTLEEWIEVYVAGLLISNTLYTLTVNADQDSSPGGDVVFDDAVADTLSIVILRTAPLNQESNYDPFDPFPSARVEGDFDKSIIIDQQQQEILGRTLRAPLDSPELGDLPPIVPLGFWRWNTEGTAIEYVELDETGTPTDSSVITYQASNNFTDGVNRSQENKNADVITPFDFGATGNGTTDDTAKFTTIGTSVPGKTIDLLGFTYLVTAIPPNNHFINGYFLINNFDENAPVRLPAFETLERHSILIDSGARYSSWPQDNCSFWNGQLVIAYNEGSGHQSDDKHVVLATSTDLGKSFSLREQPFASNVSMRVSHAGGIIDGQEYYVVREGPGGSLSELKSRRRYQSDFYTDIIEGVSGNSAYRVHQPNHGMKVGQEFTITGADNVAGQDPNGTHVVATVSNGNLFRFTGIGPADSNETAGGTFRLENLQSAFADIQPDGLDFSVAVIATDPNISTAPNLFHSMGFDSTISIDYSTLYFGYSGGGATNVSVCKVAASNEDSPTIAWARQINSTLTQGSEPSVVHDPVTGDLMGFVRSEGTGYPIRFWRSTDELATDAAITDSPWGNDFATESSIPCRIIGDELFYVLTGNRDRDGTAGSVGLYLGRVKVTDADSGIWTNTGSLLFLKNLFFSATNQTSSSNAVGVPSMAVIDNNTLAIMYSTENSPLLADADGQPSIGTIVIKIGEDNLLGVIDDGSTMTQYTEKTELISVNRIISASTFAFSGDFESNGTTVISNGLNVTEDGTGLYSATFFNENGTALTLRSNNYIVKPDPSATALSGESWSITVTLKTQTGFSYEISRGSDNALDSQPHNLGVVVFEDFTREEWQP